MEPGAHKSATDELFRRADARAERLLGVVRMAIAATLGAALALAATSPGRPDDPDIERQIILAAAVIGSYFAIGLISHLIVRRGLYAMWMAWVTATLDVLVIGANLWLNIRFSNVPSLYLFAFPAALMPALILTFGALRFRPAIQIWVTGLMAVLLLSLLFAETPPTLVGTALPDRIAMTFAPPPNMIRVLMITATGAVVALSVWRARTMLRHVARQSELRANLTRFLPSGIASDMSDAGIERLRAGRTATLAILFVDIRGFTAMAERAPPTEIADALSVYRSIVAETTEAHGGIVDKFVGDGALAVFGLDATPDQAAADALAASVDLLARIDAWNAERSADGHAAIRLGAGVHLGEVIVGAIGDDRRLEFTVLGDPVNVGARVEQMTKTLGYRLLATNEAVDAAGGVDATWRDLGEISLPGRAATVRLWGFGPVLSPTCSAS